MTEDVTFAVGVEVGALQVAAPHLRHNDCVISIAC